MAKAKGVTLKSIAARAGCSITLVSKTLNNAKGSAGAGPEAQQRILRIARQLGYRANYHARALQTGRTHTLGFVSRLESGRHHGNHYWGQLIQGVECGTRAANHDLLIIGPAGGRSEIERGIECLREKRIDALIVPTAMYGDTLSQLEAVEAPIVFVADPLPDSHPGVGVELRPGIRQAFEHLTALGHRRAIWSPVRARGAITDDARHSLVKAAARDAGVTLRTVPVDLDGVADPASVESFVEACRQQFAEYLRWHTPCSAALAYSERVAMGLYAALADVGLRVPGDVSVVSFDDIYAHATMPPMTVVSIRLDAVGEKAAELALEMALGSKPLKAYRGHVERVSAELVVRRSTGPAPGPRSHVGRRR